MIPEEEQIPKHSAEACQNSISAVKDALYVLNGKWKLPVIAALMDGAMRFNELQHALEGITPKVLSKELRELELNELVTRQVFATVPVTVSYELTDYSKSLNSVLTSLRLWGHQHREHIIASRRMKIKHAG